MIAFSVEEFAEGQFVVERHDGFWRVVLNRPQARNAMNDAMFGALETVCAALREEVSVRAVVFQGAGTDAFCAGNDITGFRTRSSGGERLRYEKEIRARLMAVGALPQVTIAAVNGACVGAGMSLAVQCDLRIAARGAAFGYPIARTLGNVLAGDVLMASRRVLGDALTREMLLGARLIDAERLHASGVVAQLVEDPADLAGEAATLAERIARLSPVTLRGTKAQLLALDLDTLTSSRDDALIRLAFSSEDFDGALAAFERRERPEFTQTDLAAYLHDRLTR